MKQNHPSLQFTLFLIREGLIWLVLLIFAPIIMLPASVLHGDLLSITWFEALLFPTFGIGVLFYLYRLATYTFGGRLVHQELLTLRLPNEHRRPLALPPFHRCKVIINQVFPGEMRDKTLQEINDLAKGGNKAAQTARKLLTDKRFQK